MPSTSRAIKYDWPDQVILFGGTPLISRVAEAVVSLGLPCTVITSPRQSSDVRPVLGSTQLCGDISAWDARSITPRSLGLCFGPAWPLSAEICAGFGERLIDFMSIPYPSYLGGAHISWARMQAESNWGCCLQLVTPETRQGEVHNGDVIKSQMFPFKEDALEDHYFKFIIDFFQDINLGATFEPIPFVPTKHHQKFHLPRLNTDIHGWIDWSWTGDEIYAFCKAFSAPYAGAKTMTSDGNHEVILTPVMLKPGICSHPFMSGLVIDVKDDVYTIAAREYALVARSSFPLRLGQRLMTPTFNLLRALRHECNYDANGDRNAG
jgi:hypothetical protein